MAGNTDTRARGEPIAVVGSGCRFPGGANSPSKLWELLKEPKDLLSRIPKERFNIEAFYHPDGTHHGCTNVQDSYFLSENAQAFDPSFFNIAPSEADCVDPQHRLLLETVYESLCTAGLKVEDLQGSSTAVYVGLMCNDYADVLTYDLDSAPAYTATGSSACILSNRVSYFFDWHGPSMTIDTACSSSLVAVHQAVQQLRNGDSKVAIAAGANMIFGPANYVIESSLGMLSPNGRSRMWDAGADGYARGEGVASVVLKTLAQALQDGDQIECIIRETGVNQDGRSAGITMPSHAMQEKLIRDTYAKAGLDLRNANDRCQYFEAHGTGTPAGDPQEAEAISSAFFGGRARAPDEHHLYVGSVKTIIGHTEGTAGIAGLLKASLAVQNAVIPPNMWFEKLSSKVEPFYNDVRILTKAKHWPPLAPGAPRRASVNSFGFGGTNAHAIIESYDVSGDCVALTEQASPSLMPIVLSANSERTLKATMESLLQFLRTEPMTNMQDLAWTLLEKRSVLPVRRALTAQTVATTCSALEKEIAALNDKQGLSTKSEHKKRKPNILGVFTGQGAQWPAMGKVLVASVPFARDIVEELDHALATLPPKYRPSWTLFEQLMLDGDDSNVQDATFSQPLCTAVQIVLVELLTAVGVTFKAVVGHSSGEIACAFAAGFITAAQAIRIAYLRGLVIGLASSKSCSAGAMLAAGTTFDDAMDLCALEKFEGRIVVAASNGPDSVTFSGDIDAIAELMVVLEDESKFARLLKVDKAYHSHHMLPCARTYIQALEACGCTNGVNKRLSSTVWLSSVHGGKSMRAADVTADYWKTNLVSPVLFSHAVERVMDEHSPLDAVVEVGCHAALKGPCLSTIQNCISGELPYTGCMQRGADDVEAFASALGYLWERFGSGGMDVNCFNALISPSARPRSLATTLPQYPWDHQKTYWVKSRTTRAFYQNERAPHPLLGRLSPHSTDSTLQWHNFISPGDFAWLDGHQLQGQTVFPGATYAIMAMEAAKHVAADREVQLLEVLDLKIGKAITFDSERSLVEVNLTVDKITEPGNTDSLVLRFNCDSCMEKENSLSWSAGGIVVLTYGTSSLSALPMALEEPAQLTETSVDRFYHELQLIGYGYTKDFRGMTSMKRSTGQSCGKYTVPRFDEGEECLALHPATLDVAFQAFIGAFCAPGDGRLRSLHVPVAIGRIAVNPRLSVVAHTSSTELSFNSRISKSDGNTIGGEVEVFMTDTGASVIQIEQISFRPFSAPTPADDNLLFSRWSWGPLNPDTTFDDKDQRATSEEVDIACSLERILYFHLRKFLGDLSHEDRLLAAPHIQNYVRWAEHVMTDVTNGRHLCYDPSWECDRTSDIQSLCARFADRADVRLIQRIGEHLADIIDEDDNAYEMMNHDGVLSEYYEKCIGCPQAYHFLGKLVQQLTHRYSNMDILEIGAGTGGATKHVLKTAGRNINSFTFTDISSAFFDQAQNAFRQYEDRLSFKSLDITKPVGPQGFPEHSYDMIIASNVLHATPKLEETLRNARSLLRPGGHLLFLELTNQKSNRAGFVFGLFPDWWTDEDEGRDLAPFISVDQWDSLLQRTGFSSIDSRTADLDTDIFALSVFSAHAVDDRVKKIDAPLALIPEGPASDIVVIGGHTKFARTILQSLQDLLPHRRFRIFAGMSDILDQALEPSSTFVILSELESEVFAQFTDDSLEAVKSVLFYARNILWLTESAWTEHPYQAMMIGLLRTLRLEHADINIQSLDIDHAGNFDVRILAKAVLRLEAEHGQLPEGILWTTEPELRCTDNRLYVPRLSPDYSRNDRHNSAYRTITTTANANESPVSLRKTKDGYLFQAEQAYSTTKQPEELVKIRTHYSLPQAIRVGNVGYLYLIQGQVVNTDQTVLALVETNASSVEVPRRRVVHLADEVGQKQPVLLCVAAELLAYAILSCAAPGSSIVVLEPHAMLVEPLLRDACAAEVRVNFASVQTPLHSSSEHWFDLHKKDSHRSLENTIPDRCSNFFDLSNEQCPVSVARRLLSNLPAFCKRYGSDYLFQDAAAVLSNSGDDIIHQLLEDAVKGMICVKPDVDSVATADLQTGLSQIDPTSVIDWRESDTMVVRVRPIDSVDLFSSGKTYLLVGLAGDLGRSLCLWMIRHGARHVVLTSRNPKVDPKWIEEMAKLGATVMLQSMNAVSRDSLVSGLAEIQLKMPAIGGIAFGPLILQDALFENMELETMQSVLDPKVEGARHLNDLFFDNDLEFFVMFSSLVMIGGNPGQSNYSAANAYMTTVAAQRRTRGLAATCIHLGAITGVGFLAKAAREEEYSINKYMFTPLAEQDLHTQFAEAVVSGRSESGGDLELMSGMPYMDPVYRERMPFFDDPRLSQFRLPDQQKKFSGAADTTSRPVREWLLEVKSMDEAYNAVKDGLTEKLRTALAMSADDEVDAETPLIDQGVDSLVAVAIRTWFSKQVDLDIPVLKVLGGASIIDLVVDACERLQASSVPLIPQGKTAEDEVPPVPAAYMADVLTATLSEVVEDSSSRLPHALGSEDSLDEDSLSRVSTRTTPLTGLSVFDGEEETKNPFDISTSADDLQRAEVMSFGQARFWLMRHLVKDPATFNVTVGLWMEGSIDLERLASAVHTSTQRHETFRTRFYEEKGRPDRPMQAIMKHSRVRFEDVPVKDKQAALEGFRELERHIYDIETGDTARIVLFHWSPTQSFLVICYHHIISDGWSYELLFNEIDKLYRNGVLPPPPQYADFAIRQRQEFETGGMDTDIAYWDSEYQTLPPVLPLLPLSDTSTRSRPVSWDYHEATYRLPPMVGARIRDRSRKHKANPVHFYLAAYQVLIARLSGSTDISIGLSDANRSSLDDLVTLGFFINLLPIRLQYSASQTFGESIGQAKTKVREALLHSKVPFDVLLQRLNIPRASTHAPLFQVGFDYKQGQAESGSLGDTIMTGVEQSSSRAAMDIMVEILDDPKRDPKITLKLQRSIYAKEDAQALLKSFTNILVTFSRNPSLTVEEPRLFARGDVDQAVQLGNGSNVVNTLQSTVIAQIHDRCNLTPNQIALKGMGVDISYSELAEKVNDLASVLIDHGVASGAKVVSIQTPTPAWVCSMLAVMQIGAIYVPVDPSLPETRMSAIIEDSKPAAILVNSAIIAEIALPAIAKTALPGAELHVIDVTDIPGSGRVGPCRASAEQPCAILYTSGTTGTPKGHLLSHRSVLNNIDGTMTLLGTEPLHVLQQSALTFDMSIWQPLLGLASGGSVYVVPPTERRDPRAISQIVAENGVSCMVATPLEYASWIQVGSDHLQQASAWKYALTGGEALSHAVLRKFGSLNLPQLRVFNSYGPAEICFYSHAIEIAYSEKDLPDRVPIGLPMPNYSAYVVDEQLRPMPAGWPGEILIGGLGVGMGYLNQPELTANAFIPDTLANADQKARGFTTLFRSGDRGRLRADGALLFDGRLDGGTQIKLRGIRIELQDIEACILNASSGVLTNAVVTVRGEGAARFLVAHVVFSPEHSQLEREAYLHQLRSSLAVPNYMRPTVLVELDTIPTSRHSKVDRDAVTRMALPIHIGSQQSTSALTPREREIWQLWRDVLPEEAVADVTPDTDTDFIDMGGNSILIVQLHAALQESIGRRIALVELFENTTIREMADRVDTLLALPPVVADA